MPILDFENYDASSVTVGFMGQAAVIELKSIEWNAKQTVSPVYGAGNQPIALGVGAAEYSGKMELQIHAVNKMMQAAVFAGINANSLIDLPSFDIAISMQNGVSAAKKTTLRGCKFTEHNFKSASGDTEIMMDIPFMFLQVLSENA
jgi:hypothetical protein